MAPIPRKCVVLATLLLLALGCNNGKTPPLSAALAECQQGLDELRTENNRLQEQLSIHRSKTAELQSQIDNLTIKNRELAQWSQQVAERFGPSVWFVGPDEKPLPYKSIRNGSPQRLLGELNALFRQSNLPQVVLQKIEGDTAYIHIDDDQRLTQEMGTTGATAYIQAVTYTLTSVPSIKSVAFDFEAGDHALPGRYSR